MFYLFNQVTMAEDQEFKSVMFRHSFTLLYFALPFTLLYFTLCTTSIPKQKLDYINFSSERVWCESAYYKRKLAFFSSIDKTMGNYQIIHFLDNHFFEFNQSSYPPRLSSSVSLATFEDAAKHQCFY